MYMTVPSGEVVGLPLMSGDGSMWSTSVSRGHDFPGTAARPLPRDDGAAFEDLAAPDAPRLTPVQRAREAGVPDRAVTAQDFGLLELRRALGEPQLRVRLPARQRPADRPGRRGGGSSGGGPPGPGELGPAVGRRAVDRLLHCRPSSFSVSATAGGSPPTGDRCRGTATKRKAADPGVRVPRPRGGPVERLALRSPRGVDPEGGAVDLEGLLGHDVVADGLTGDGTETDGGADSGHTGPLDRGGGRGHVHSGELGQTAAQARAVGRAH